MLYRKIQKDIKEWIYKGKEALLVTGARQIGKTYSIKETLKREGVDYVDFNFIEQPEVLEAFKRVETKGVEALLSRLTFISGHKFIKGKTIIFFDEVQEYKEIVTMIKFLVEEGSFKYILSGSLLGVELNDLRSSPVGSLRTLDMYPMDLEEFLYAMGIQSSVIDELKQCYERREPVDEFIHDRLIDAFYIYLIVGGMPRAVQAYVKEKDFNKVMQEHNAIIPMYKNDFSKYEIENRKLKLRKIYDLIPSEIASKNKRYIYSNLDKEHRPERYESSFEWLKKAGVSIPVYNVSEPKIPLESSKKSNLMKLFLSDVGLLTSMYGRATIIETLNGTSNINYGAMFENVVAQELKAHGYDGYYFNSKKQGELDFLIEYENKCLPIEVKSGKDYKIHSALNNVLNDKNYDIPFAYVLSNGNVEVNGKVIYLPIYMIMFINENKKEIPTVPRIDLSNLR